MARKRMIDPKFWTDEKLGTLSVYERLLFMGLISNADDKGRLPGHPKIVKGTVFPYDSISEKRMLEMIRSLHDSGLIVCYEANGQQYIYVVNFLKHQYIKKPQESSYPEPQEYLTSTVPVPYQDGTEATPKEKNRIEKNRIEEKDSSGGTATTHTTQYMDFVYLTDEEHLKLVDKLGEPKTLAYIEKLNGYIGQMGEKKAKTKYSSHYFVILNWVRRDNDQSEAKKSGKMGFGNFQQRDYDESELEKLIDNR
jgi:hypothetical protein